MEYQNKYISCMDCGDLFTFTVGEQKFIQQLVAEGKFKSAEDPKRCPNCRKKRKELYKNNLK